MPNKIKPMCANCAHCVQDVERPVPKWFRKPIFYPNFFCGNSLYERTDFILGETFMPWCEELNDKGQCPSYVIRDAYPPEIIYAPDTRTVSIFCLDKIMYSLDGENFLEYTEEFEIAETVTVYAYSVFGTKVVDGETVENKSSTVNLPCPVESSADPADPSTPTDPSEPSEPSDPAEPNEPADPASSTDPTEPDTTQNDEGSGEP